MRLTTASEYALLALLYMARHYAKGYTSLSKIAKDQKLPFKYMERLMHTLCRAQIILSLKGQRGGYKLAHRPEKVSVAQIIRLLDGQLASVSSVSVHFYKPTITEREKKLTKLLREIRNYVSSRLENTTLKDLI